MMEDWAEIRRLHRSEGMAVKAIARRLGLARNTVRAALVAANPYRVWTPRVRTQAQVAAAFGLLDVVRVDLSSRPTGGAVKVAVAYSSTGVATSLSGEALRTKLGLPSTWVSAATPR